MQWNQCVMPIRIKLALLAVLLVVLGCFASAEKIADVRPQGYVTDLAGVIESEMRPRMAGVVAAMHSNVVLLVHPLRIGRSCVGRQRQTETVAVGVLAMPLLLLRDSTCGEEDAQNGLSDRPRNTAGLQQRVEALLAGIVAGEHGREQRTR